MYCDSCGTKIDEGQNFCRACGKAVGSAPLARATVPASPRVAANLRVLGVLWIAMGVVRLIPGFVLISFSHWQLPSEVPQDVQSFIHPLIYGVGWVFLVGGAVCFISGWGLLDRAPWARMFTIVLGAVSLIEIPLGTAIGIYTLWVLLPESSEHEYRQLSGG